MTQMRLVLPLAEGKGLSQQRCDLPSKPMILVSCITLTVCVCGGAVDCYDIPLRIRRPHLYCTGFFPVLQ
jgi:hypothetical protein